MNEEVSVAAAGDVSCAEHAARNIAAAVFDEKSSSNDVALAARELAWNLIKHGRGGYLRIRTISEEKREGLQIEAIDEGPGIADVEEATRDGYSTTTGSLGYGLGAVNRCMDEVEIRSPRPGHGRGTLVKCRKWSRKLSPVLLDVGTVSRSLPGMEENGDAFVVRRLKGSLLTGVIDGLGHGQHAHRASRAARQYVEKHAESPSGELFRGISPVCRATRGVVMMLARFDYQKQQLSIASIGNIGAKMFRGQTKLSLVLGRGIVGSGDLKPAITQHPLEPGAIFIMCSDGVGSSWTKSVDERIARQDADAIARHIISGWAKTNDDATAVVVKIPASLERVEDKG